MNLQDVLKGYFENDDSNDTSHFLNESLGMFSVVPIVAQKKDDWEVVSSPNRLHKTYEFKSQEMLQNFLNEMLDYQNSVSHHGKFIIDYLSVTLEIYTHDIDDVTEIDFEWAQMADHIYEDVKHYAPTEFR